ncbi:MAG: arsenosugar biosynthesis radical SAM (seleno)protein ArsS [Syntrophorhabdales bacterium]
MNAFEEIIARHGYDGLQSQEIGIIQVNLGLKCNQQCIHCHVEAGPWRTEMMGWPMMEMVLEAAARIRPRLVDLTGGAPELNPDFRRFVEGLCRKGLSVQVRTNLTALFEPGMEDLPDFFGEHKVQVVASLPCYKEENVRSQRGPGVYEKSIAVIKRLNGLGYGVDSLLPLSLAYNPGGPFLPSAQTALEADYRRELASRFGLSFTHLFTITNMPLGRFHKELIREHQDDAYARLLRSSFNPETVPGLMCRHQVNIGWDGTIYDCDFNLALGLPVNHGAPDHIERFEPVALTERRIMTGEHCLGCTAGAGSSCAGSIVP